MKTFNITFNADKPNQLMAKFALCIVLSISSYYQLEKIDSRNSRSAIQLDTIQNNQFSEFDKESIPNSSRTIKEMIMVLRPSLPSETIEALSIKISAALKGSKIPPQVVVSIIDTESVFDQNAVSATGDLSLAQINPEIWNKEFIRRGMEPVDIDRLKNDHEYSLSKMIQILSLLKKRYEKSDRRWYARYHSRSKKFKMIYLAKLDVRMKVLESYFLKSASNSSNKKLVALK